MARPISFWGGVDPSTGRVSDPRHPDHGASVAGTVLALSETIGSSSSSAVMLELIAQDLAPRALLLGRLDAILTLGVVVAREMGLGSIPVLRIDVDRLPQSGFATILQGGEISFAE
jgi:predicted aconitase with swiveling domain